MDIASVDAARAEVRRLGAVLTEYELRNPGIEIPTALLRAMADASRHLVRTIGDYIVHRATPSDVEAPVLSGCDVQLSH